MMGGGGGGGGAEGLIIIRISACEIWRLTYWVGEGGAGIVFGIVWYSAAHSQFNVGGVKSLQFFRLVSPSLIPTQHS